MPGQGIVQVLPRNDRSPPVRKRVHLPQTSATTAEGHRGRASGGGTARSEPKLGTRYDVAKGRGSTAAAQTRSAEVNWWDEKKRIAIRGTHPTCTEP
jgi:hypothetical protein